MPKQNTTFDKISKLITASRFNEAFLLLKREMQKFPNLANEGQKLLDSESTYRHMLAYLAVGHDDPSRKDMTEQIRETLFSANDAWLRESMLAESSDIYYSTRRLFNLRKESFMSLSGNFKEKLKEDRIDDFEASETSNTMVDYDSPKISASQAKAINDVFNYVWTMDNKDASDYKEVEKDILDPEMPEYYRALLVSAVILGNISYFNPLAYSMLLNISESTDSLMVKARTLVGILLIALLYPHRLSGNLDLKSRLMISSEDEELKGNFNDILLRIIKTYDTARIDSKMRNEVIPGLMKIKPEIIDKMRNMASDSENFLSDANPDWEDFLENSEISKKLQEINDMQLEGADVMVTAFSNLKSFPFFNSISNWFLPFNPRYYEFDALPLEKTDENIALLTTVMCDSDLHSFLLSLNSLPEENKSQMLSNMKAQMKEAQEAFDNPLADNAQITLKKYLSHSLQDLYRFFKFFRKNTEFTDPFGSPFIAFSIEKVKNLMGLQSENIQLAAEFYFKNKYFEESAGMFELVDKIQPGNFNIWEKIGFSYDRMRLYSKAVEWYRKADLVNPGNPWLERKLAVALKNAGSLSEALEYYTKALEREPENYHLLLSLAQCLIELGDYAEALKHLFHAQYLKPDKLDVTRAIAWAYLLDGKFDKANEYYIKIRIHPEAEKTDFLNAAHSLLANGNFKDALKNYRTFVDKTPDRNITNLVIAFRDDAEIIKKLGIKTADLRLIVDKIRYDMLLP